MYTELILGVKFKKNTPNDVIETLRYMVGDIDKPKQLAFECDRNPLRGSSYYFAISNSVSKIWLDFIDDCWRLSSRANIKNYENDIEKFLEWIKPYIDEGSGEREMYAIVIYEESSEPTIYYLYDE